MAQNSLIDFSDDDHVKGFRLDRLEVYNWGTFDQSVWMIEPHGFNSLMTGDIGSGKSTLVDAITTLLVPPKKITFNKAAGAERKERTLLSYVLGSHKNESDGNNNSRPVNLRDDKDYSVILCYFFNRGHNIGMTLAQILWVNADKVNRLFVTSTENLNILDHFSPNEEGTDIDSLKRQIKSIPNASVFDTYIEYSNSFRPYLGIRSDKVLELFFQTVSMKSIDKLTVFMRNHMLEKVDFKNEITEMISSYDNLTRAYESVQRAKEQLNLLDPMMNNISKYEEVTIEIERLYDCLKYLPYYFSERKHALLIEEIEFCENTLAELKKQIASKKTALGLLREKEIDISIAISKDKDGQRIHGIEKEIGILEQEKEVKFSKQKRYSDLCKSVEIKAADNEQSFKRSISDAKEKLIQIEHQVDKNGDERDESLLSKSRLEASYNEYREEFESLNQRKTKIPSSSLDIRNNIVVNCALEDIELPFVGELITINPNEREWEGSLERLLHNFGLSLLVPEEHYRTISQYVNQTDLRGRLVYFKVPSTSPFSSDNEIRENTIINKLEIKEDSKFYNWIRSELITRFDFVCCETIEQFQKEKRAITNKGQIKGSRGKHEKDDRNQLYDRKRFVLGWDNKEKIATIKEQMDSLHQQFEECAKDLERFKTRGKELETQKGNLYNLLEIKDFEMINWQKIATRIQDYKNEIAELEQSSNQLKTLKSQRSQIQERIAIEEDDHNKLQVDEALTIDRKTLALNEFEECKVTLSESPFSANKEKPDLSPHLKTDEFSITTIDRELSDTEKSINGKIAKKITKIRSLTEDLAAQMAYYKKTYPEETIELGVNMTAIPDFVAIYKKLDEENLPKYKEKFEKELHEHTTQSIITFKGKLENEVQKIKKNIKIINQFLHELDYNPGTYIELRAEEVTDLIIKRFRNDLKECISDTFGSEDVYSEERFYKVKHLLDQFKTADTVDNNWTNKVTDVRNWLNFSAAERLLSDGSEKEYYSDSSGKSGGQKEKLAYTILASALAYRFGPAGDKSESNSFRFVIIDEAFGRSSDESTEYGLELFKKLNLQLLLIIPLKNSIDVAIDYVNYIHLISNRDGNYSMIKNFTMKQYEEDKEKYQMEVGI
ncbi:Uncharacterized protein YPO0396 [Methanolobus vulcani]|uniref:Uncharacterized protein YPO0396 n=1 Tax=Methanolobus vulcani TaxID=38026 RepID=A0A7Z7FCX0_9EURY|nr:ATP-binding protein [Methanolobus vulcani]SDF93567.1 Uncharacterized protein YPO0396 [Methanolobus vulcani]